MRPTALTANYGGYDLFESFTSSGTLNITQELGATVNTTHVYDAYTWEMDLTGTATPGTDVGAFSLALTGPFDDGQGGGYDVTTDWDCTTSNDAIDCTGTTNLDAYVLTSTVSFDQ